MAARKNVDYQCDCIPNAKTLHGLLRANLLIDGTDQPGTDYTDQRYDGHQRQRARLAHAKVSDISRHQLLHDTDRTDLKHACHDGCKPQFFGL